MTATATPVLPAGTWTADPIHSTIGFAVKHMVVATFRSRFTEFDAALTATEDGALQLDGTVNAASIDVDNPDFAAHLRAPDFFDTEQYPELRFTSSELEIGDDNSVTLHGELTIKGITKPVTATGEFTPATDDAFGGVRAGLELTATLDRREYGLNWNQPLPKGGLALSNDVKLTIDLELTLAQEA